MKHNEKDLTFPCTGRERQRDEKDPTFPSKKERQRDENDLTFPCTGLLRMIH